jgi:hypothetical protein
MIFRLNSEIYLKIFGMNKNVNNFSSILIDNIHVLHFLILICTYIYAFYFYLHFNSFFIDFKMQ